MATASTSHGRVLHAALYSRVKLVIDKVQKNKESIILYYIIIYLQIDR